MSEHQDVNKVKKQRICQLSVNSDNNNNDNSDNSDNNNNNNFFLNPTLGDFPGGAVVMTLCSRCRGPGFNPWSRN